MPRFHHGVLPFIGLALVSASCSHEESVTHSSSDASCVAPCERAIGTPPEPASQPTSKPSDDGRDAGILEAGADSAPKGPYGPPGPPSLYFNSGEPGCNGSSPNPDYLFCDDFEDGDWVTKDCDAANGSGGLLQTDGWCATIYYGPDPEGTHFGRCGGRGAAGTDCAAGTGPHGGVGSAMMADRNFRDQQSVNEFYFRYYIKPLPGYLYGAQKMLTINKGFAGVGGIYFGGLGSCAGGCEPRPYAELAIVANYDAVFYGDDPAAYNTKVWRHQNLGNAMMIEPGNWYYVEYHVKLNTPGTANGIWEVWIDNCGAGGTGCTGPGTLRSRHTDVMWVAPGDASLVGSVWLENWSNPASTGEQYYDQIIASKSRIGPMN